MLGVAGYFLWTLCLARIGIDSDKGSIKKTLLYFVFIASKLFSSDLFGNCVVPCNYVYILYF